MPTIIGPAWNRIPVAQTMLFLSVTQSDILGGPGEGKVSSGHLWSPRMTWVRPPYRKVTTFPVVKSRNAMPNLPESLPSASSTGIRM